MAGLLFRLVSDLMHDDRVRRRFNAEPRAMMNEYGLNDEARMVLQTMDRKLIADYVAEEYKNWSFPPWDLEEDDPECRKVIQAMYPDPKPQVYTISPDTAAKGSKIAVTVKGEGFSKGSTLTLVNGATKVKAKDVVVTGTYRCAHLDATLALGGAPAGKYEVQVTINDGKYKRTLPAPASVRFKVT